MAHRLMKMLIGGALCLSAQTWSLALAQEGDLTLPGRPSDVVTFSLHSPPVDRNGPDILQVFVGPVDACCTGKTPIAGRYLLDDQTIIFDPAFDFIAGQRYTIRSHDGTVSLSSFTIPLDDATPAPAVVAIYPSGPEIPENTLRFYIQFSTPMMPHRADEFISLLDADNEADDAAFMSFTQELWNEDRTRLTLLMDPGRIKRGVAQNVTLGSALVEGQQQSIVIAEGWPSALVRQSARQFEHSFTVSPALRTLPDTDLWQFQPPQVGASTPLVITLDRPFDYQSVQRAITIKDADGQAILGTVSVKSHERTLWFEPNVPWNTPTIEIAVDARLEDVAGNNFRDLLDHAVGTDTQNDDQLTIILNLPGNP